MDFLRSVSEMAEFRQSLEGRGDRDLIMDIAVSVESLRHFTHDISNRNIALEHEVDTRIEKVEKELEEIKAHLEAQAKKEKNKLGETVFKSVITAILVAGCLWLTQGLMYYINGYYNAVNNPSPPSVWRTCSWQPVTGAQCASRFST